ncbi:MAG TPA: lysophospholipid acyltransferase family protein [Chitinophagaceae bacterium]|nr:lysophospholipid acyltransferase family protein [Chitinophagaceae bacterium]HNF70769.1 lysophospholipid acyltransferase family protein [Chitinophagaceae bacterium]
MYYLLYSLLYLLSLLPFGVLYVLSDLLCFFLHRVFRYRMDVIEQNLFASFPEWTAEERHRVIKDYYHNLCDSVVETIKLLSVSRRVLEKRMKGNWDVFEIMQQKSRNAQALIAHQFNWEWATVLTNWQLPEQFTGLYLPLNNKHFNRLMKHIRMRAGMKLVKVQDMQNQLAVIQSSPVLWGFIADQNPSDPRRVSWNRFMNRTTAFFKGPEFVARRYNNLVYFGEIIRIRRGYYEVKLKLAFDNSRETSEGEITERYVRFLEESIKRQPANWVWSHRRWKHQPPQTSS